MSLLSESTGGCGDFSLSLFHPRFGRGSIVIAADRAVLEKPWLRNTDCHMVPTSCCSCELVAATLQLVRKALAEVLEVGHRADLAWLPRLALAIAALAALALAALAHRKAKRRRKANR